MKSLNIFSTLSVGLMLASLASCENQDIDFPDSEKGVSTYFAYQTPVRTVVLGEDEKESDDARVGHKVKIYATMGGSYKGRNIDLNIAVDPSLCNHLYFVGGQAVTPMPQSYYQLAGSQIHLNGDMRGYVDVQLTDAFFNDPKSLTTNYVIPVVIESQKGADRILTGTPAVEGTTPQRTNTDAWEVAPMDYVLYCVKYQNKFQAYYVRHGVDNVNGATQVRHKKEWMDDEICNTVSKSLNTVTLKLTNPVDCELLLTFDLATNKCTVSSLTDGVTASGNGFYGDKTEKNSWGAKDRDALYLDYTINTASQNVATKDTLIWQRSGVQETEEFSYEYRE